MRGADPGRRSHGARTVGLSRVGRPGRWAVGGATALLLLLAGCATVPAAPPAPTSPLLRTAPPIPGGVPAAARPEADIPVVAATLAPPETPVAPVRVQVPDRDVDVRVTPVGVDRKGAMVLPANPSVAGWYRWSSDGDATRGTTVLAAHVDSLRWGLGPFVRIRDLPRDAEIRITADDGSRRTYRVESIERVRKAALPDRLFDRTGPHRLVLVTCGGTFDTTSRTYSDNVIVTARPTSENR